MLAYKGLFAVGVLALFAGSGAASAAQPFLLGAYANENVSTFETMIGHTIAMVWHGQEFAGLPKGTVPQDIAAGRVPLIMWTSNTVQGGSASVRATDILRGVYDQQLDAQADAFAALGGTVLLEWQPEMTDNARNAAFFTGIAPAQWGPAYVSVWMYIHDIFVARRATNVQWVWSPGGDGYEPLNKGAIRCQSYFPGAAYVNWMGLHSYNKSNTAAAYDANPELRAFYAAAPAWAPGLPLINAQTGATSTTAAQSEWIATAQTTLKTEFPLIRGFVWWNAAGKSPLPGDDKQYTLAGLGITDFSAMAADPYFNQ